MNRAARRALVHDLRTRGCTCRPKVENMPRDQWVPGAVQCHVVTHDTGCPLGDQMARFNAAGWMPALRAPVGSRCER